MVLHFGKKLIEGPSAEVLRSQVVRKIYMGLADEAA
jgi:ABC-type branched-subunit amino acid transport system ATPase component